MPVASDQSRCGSGTLILTASGGTTYRWYQNATGGAILFTGSSFTTPILTATDSFYVANFDGTNESLRTKVRAFVHAIPNAPVAQDVSRCGPGTVTLSATGGPSLRWFAAASGGGALFTGASFTTPSLNTNTTYYVEAFNTNCNSARIPVQAIIDALPAVPVSQNESRCGSGSLTFTANAANPVEWFAAPTGGSPINTGASFTTPILNNNTSYYIAANNGTCSSARIQVDAIIEPVPAAPPVADEGNCGPGTVTFNISGSLIYEWYDVSSGGVSLHTGSSFTTPQLTTTTTYYVQAIDGNCISPRTAVDALILSALPDPVANDVNRCGDGTLILTATAPGADGYN
nr:hypothetical protein [Bacteroidota bacterium]